MKPWEPVKPIENAARPIGDTQLKRMAAQEATAVYQ